MDNKDNHIKLEVNDPSMQRSQSTWFNQNQHKHQEVEFKTGLDVIPEVKNNEHTALHYDGSNDNAKMQKIVQFH